MANRRIEKFSIVDYCLENHSDWKSGGCVDLADAFKALHDKYRWRYADIHDKFKREVDIRRNEVYITRTSDIWLRGVERRRYPIYNNQWYGSLMRMNNESH